MYLAAEDQAREGERIREEYAVPGGNYQEYVQMDIDTFKELGSTQILFIFIDIMQLVKLLDQLWIIQWLIVTTRISTNTQDSYLNFETDDEKRKYHRNPRKSK